MISKKNKRKIRVNNTDFWWWINPEFSPQGDMLSINVATEDKKFLIRYFVVHADNGSSQIQVIGEYFPGLQKKSGNSQYILCPRFMIKPGEKAVTPKLVAEIVSWCFDAGRSGSPVNR
jgi:hypothetical protein